MTKNGCIQWIYDFMHLKYVCTREAKIELTFWKHL